MSRVEDPSTSSAPLSVKAALQVNVLPPYRPTNPLTLPAEVVVASEPLLRVSQDTGLESVLVPLLSEKFSTASDAPRSNAWLLTLRL